MYRVCRCKWLDRPSRWHFRPKPHLCAQDCNVHGNEELRYERWLGKRRTMQLKLF